MTTEKELLTVLMETAYKTPFVDVAPRLYKQGDDGELTNELNENAHEILLQIDAERIAKLAVPAVNPKELFDKGFSEGKGKTAQQWEKMIRAEYPDVDKEGKLQGDQLVRAIKAAMVQSANDPEAVKRSPEYLQLETSMREQIEAKEAEWQAKFQGLETEFVRKQQWAETSKELLAEFIAAGPVLPADAGKAARLTDDFIQSKFSDYDFQKVDGQTLRLKKDVTHLTNAHGHVIFLPELVKMIGDQYFDFVKQPPAGNAGNTNDDRQKVTVKFKDEADFLAQLSAIPMADSAGRAALGSAWKLQRAG